MKLKALLIDDEKNCLTSLAHELSITCPEVEIIEECLGSKDGLKAISKHSPDLVFLDIDMPYINGFELLEMIPEVKFATIFTTAYDKYALRAFKISAVDYLLKPVASLDLRQAVDKVIKQRDHLNEQRQINFLIEQMQAIESDTVKKVAFPTFEGVEFVALKDINYCKGDNNYTHVYLGDGSSLLISKTLRHVEEMLCDYQFLRVHNSYIVNLDYITKYVKGDGGYVVMEDGTNVTVSRSKKTELMKRFAK